MAVYENIIFALFLLIGAFHIACVFFNWDWFFKSFQASRVVKAFGRTGARIVYGLLGLMLILFAVSTKVDWL